MSDNLCRHRWEHETKNCRFHQCDLEKGHATENHMCVCGFMGGTDPDESI